MEPKSSSERPLPVLAHLARVPQHIDAQQLAWLSHNADKLPFVYLVAHSDSRPDQSGHVLLTKGAVGQWWVTPELISECLQYRSLMDVHCVNRAEKQSALEAAGLVQAFGGGWHWRIEHSFHVDGHLYRVLEQRPCPATKVHEAWCSTNKESLFAASSGPDGDFLVPYQTCVSALVQEALSSFPEQVSTLHAALARLCAQATDAPSFQGKANEAYVDWHSMAAAARVKRALASKLHLDGYPEQFPLARSMARRISLFVGPPNSGKTHTAFESLGQANSGVYLAPLRLLALEGRDRLVASGVACSLLTGEECEPVEQAKVTSCTVEMLNLVAPIDVAVLDEAQMVFDADRGWAWTQALVGTPAKHLIVICSAYAAPVIESILQRCGEQSERREFERKQGLAVMPAPADLTDIRPADAIVAFSRKDVLVMGKTLLERGHQPAIIYGALPPEVRRAQAQRFANGQADVLVATDAIGMGLNLPIRRVLFARMEKFDGTQDRPLDTSEVHQIAGRAGRYGLTDEGQAGVLSQAGSQALKILRKQLASQPRAPANFRAQVAPSLEHVRHIDEALQLKYLSLVLEAFCESLELDGENFRAYPCAAMIELAQQLDMFASALSLQQRFVYAQAPVDLKSPNQVEHLLRWARSHARTGKAGQPDFLEAGQQAIKLDDMETVLRLCSLWRWLGLRFEAAYGSVEIVSALQQTLAGRIEQLLADGAYRDTANR